MKYFLLILILIIGLFVINCSNNSLVDQGGIVEHGDVDQNTDCVVYDRGDWNQWVDADKDCQDTRQEVLNSENLLGQADDCNITEGRWVDPYTGIEYVDPSDLDIDHFVPLAEAHESGGANWDQKTKELYANDLGYPEHLVAMSSSENRSKGKRDPAEWLPDSSQYWKQYVLDWVKVKVKWGLSADSAELVAIKSVLENDTLTVEEFPNLAEETRCSLVTQERDSTITSLECCKMCTPGVSKPCGDSCISESFNCTKPVGCACYK